MVETSREVSPYKKEAFYAVIIALKFLLGTPLKTPASGFILQESLNNMHDLCRTATVAPCTICEMAQQVALAACTEYALCLKVCSGVHERLVFAAFCTMRS